MHKTKRHFYGLLCAGLFPALLQLAACGNGDRAGHSPFAATSDSAVPVQRVETDQSPRLAWTDSLVLKYIRSTSTTMEPELRDSLTYFFDRREISDTAHYLIYQIGHSSEGNFTTDHWLYLDSARRAAYEYDVVNDSLMRWPG